MWARVVAGRVLTTSGFGRAAGGSTAGKELSPRCSLSTYSALDSSCRLTLGSLKSGLLELCAFEIFLLAQADRKSSKFRVTHPSQS